MHFLVVIGLLLFKAGMVYAASPDQAVLPVSVTWDSGPGTNIHLVGNHPDTGNWSPTSSIKLRWTAGNVWTGQIGVQLGTALEYKFVARSFDAASFCDLANTTWEPGSNRTADLPASPAAPYAGKRIYYYSAWTSASVVVITPTGAAAHAFQQVGSGRTPGEFLYRAENVGEEGEWIEFVPNGWENGTNYWDNPLSGGWNNNYYTRLDTFLLQDKNLYTYWPSNQVSAPQIVTSYVFSSISGITGRPVRVLLPRGYTEHTWKRYPVLYMQDGQHVFANSRVPASAPVSWSADLAGEKETAQGRMRECIIAAIDNSPLRQSEYNAPTDQYPGQPAGTAHLYLQYLAANVRPTLDFNFRTLNDRRNTLVGGSSMGGLVSLYAGYETNLFGGVLAMSPAITRAPNYTALLYARSKQPMRIYLDTGTDEGNVGPGIGNYWEKPWEAYDIMLLHGYAAGSEVIMRAGCGHQHNESAWQNRLPDALRFLLDPLDEPNLLTQERTPPAIESQDPSGDTGFTGLHRFRYHLEESSELQTPSWIQLGTPVTRTSAWGSALLSPGAVTGTAFRRLAAEPAW